MVFSDTLQNSFYIVGLVYMSVNLIVIIALLSAVLVIKAKINRLQQAVEMKINKAKDVADKASIIFRTLKYFAKR